MYSSNDDDDLECGRYMCVVVGGAVVAMAWFHVGEIRSFCFFFMVIWRFIL